MKTVKKCTLPLLFVFLMLMGCSANSTEKADDLVRTLYTMPNAQIVEIVLPPPPEEPIAGITGLDIDLDALNKVFDHSICEEYLGDFYLKGGLDLHIKANEVSGSTTVREIITETKDENTLYYTAQLTCTDNQGNQSDVTAKGSLRFNEDGLIENHHSQGGIKEILEAIGYYKYWAE